MSKERRNNRKQRRSNLSEADESFRKASEIIDKYGIEILGKPGDSDYDMFMIAKQAREGTLKVDPPEIGKIYGEKDMLRFAMVAHSPDPEANQHATKITGARISAGMGNAIIQEFCPDLKLPLEIGKFTFISPELAIHASGEAPYENTSSYVLWCTEKSIPQNDSSRRYSLGRNVAKHINETGQTESAKVGIYVNDPRSAVWCVTHVKVENDEAFLVLRNKSVSQLNSKGY